MTSELSGAFGALRLLTERKAVVAAQAAELRTHLQFLEKELETLIPAARELGKSIIPLEGETLRGLDELLPPLTREQCDFLLERAKAKEGTK